MKLVHNDKLRISLVKLAAPLSDIQLETQLDQRRHDHSRCLCRGRRLDAPHYVAGRRDWKLNVATSAKPRTRGSHKVQLHNCLRLGGPDVIQNCWPTYATLSDECLSNPDEVVNQRRTFRRPCQLAYRATATAARVGLEPTYTGLNGMYSEPAVRVSRDPDGG